MSAKFWRAHSIKNQPNEVVLEVDASNINMSPVIDVPLESEGVTRRTLRVPVTEGPAIIGATPVPIFPAVKPVNEAQIRVRGLK